MQIRVLPFLLLSLVAPAAIGACLPNDTTVCLNQQRFAIDVQWQDFSGNTGAGHAAALTGDTGYFWFFNSSNVELVIKVLDATSVNQHFWVYYGSLSNVAYSIHIVDTATGHERTYSNPLGTFASFGDTSAFPSTAAPEIASAPPAPKKVDDDAGCPADPHALYLSQCRFRVEAKWKDFAGNTGTGNAVRLTSDTGYFWFFNDSNVELVLKVLDATSFSDKFWVFFGALSNVEYTVTVTDTVTGNVKTYTNPSGQFASVGDTAAFPSGPSVKATADSSRTTSATIGPTGGTLSATAGDGSRFTLTIPPDALMNDEDITMTPVTSIGALPLSGGMSAAVQIGPDSLRLFAPATLTIEPASALAAGTLHPVGFGYHRSGDEFYLRPQTVDGNKVTMQLMHFSGYGVGSGTDADVKTQSRRRPASAEDNAQQASLIIGDAYEPTLAWWKEGLEPEMFGATSDPVRFAIWFMSFYAWQKEMSATQDPRAAAVVDAAWQEALAGLDLAIKQAHTSCVLNHDVSDLLRFIAIAGRQDVMSHGAGKFDADRELVGQCLTFQLVFDSHVRSEAPGAETYDSTVHAEVTFHEELDANNHLVVVPASGPLNYVDFTALFGSPSCVIDTEKSGSTFEIVNDTASQWSRIDFDYDYAADPFVARRYTEPREIALAMKHGDPTDHIIDFRCGNIVTPNPYGQGPDWWQGGWAIFHGGIYSGENDYIAPKVFQIKDWDYAGGDLWAQKTFQRSHTEQTTTFSENTTFKLYHRPQ